MSATMIERTNTLRKRHPDVPQRTFARQIFEADFPKFSDSAAASEIDGAQATIYGRIRRYDKANKPKVAGVFNVGDKVKVVGKDVMHNAVVMSKFIKDGKTYEVKIKEHGGDLFLSNGFFYKPKSLQHV